MSHSDRVVVRARTMERGHNMTRLGKSSVCSFMQLISNHEEGGIISSVFRICFGIISIDSGLDPSRLLKAEEMWWQRRRSHRWLGKIAPCIEIEEELIQLEAIIYTLWRKCEDLTMVSWHLKPISRRNEFCRGDCILAMHQRSGLTLTPPRTILQPVMHYSQTGLPWPSVIGLNGARNTYYSAALRMFAFLESIRIVIATWPAIN